MLVPEPDEHREDCDGAFVCATDVLEKAGELTVFVFSQFGRLFWSPLVFTEGFVAAAVDLVQSLREVETVVLVAVLCGDERSRMEFASSGVSVFCGLGDSDTALTPSSRSLFRHIWLRIPSFLAPPTTETRRPTEQVRRLEARIAETKSTKATAGSASRDGAMPSTSAVDSSPTGQKRMVCWWCGSPNHFQADCPLKPKKTEASMSLVWRKTFF